MFMIPGSTGCPGFMANQKDFDAFGALQKWVETGEAPESIVFTQRDRGSVNRTRPTCVYPKIAKYKGSGDVNSAASFDCVDPR
jgi:hypothetical protein